MSKFYDKPELVVHMYDIRHSIFTDSGDNNDGDIYDITVNSPNNPDMNVFGD